MDVNPDRLVTRHFRIDAGDAAVVDDALAAVGALHGVQDATWHAEDGTLNVLYDNGVEQLDEVLETLRRQGLVVHEDWHSRLSETLWRFDDSLVRAGAEATERHTPGA